jgi:16S rRNA (cytosine967-C5)-methyltransferase
LAQVSPARKIAFEVLLQVDAGQAFASDLLQSRRVSPLSERDRGLATELVFGVLRWRGEIDHRLEQLSGKRPQSLDCEVLTALRVGIYQIAFLEKIPTSAAVNESVELTKLAGKKSAAGLVNAVLRKCQPEKLLQHSGPDQLNDPEFLMSVRRTVPAWMLNRWEKNFGTDAANRLAWSATRVPPSTLRVCSCTPEPHEVISKLAEKGCSVRWGRYTSNALVAEAGEAIVARLADQMGLAIQDEASQIVPELLQARSGDCVLDLCAAPGMKTSLLADAVGHGLVMACDSSSRRLQTLRKLQPRLTANVRAVRVVRLDAMQPLPFGQSFERVLVDAPCSGTGTLARNPEIKWRLTSEDIDRLAVMQRAILSNALSALAPGGRLVYATCSLEPEENEKVVQSVLAATSDCRLLSRAELADNLPEIAPLIDERGYFHTRPDLDGMDGFFAAAMSR